jgi:hypothetical protein
MQTRWFADLVLEERDQQNSKSYTKTCFESLALAALHDSSPENLLTLEEIQERVATYLPTGHETQVSQQTASALRRLARKGGPVHLHAKAGKIAYHTRNDCDSRKRSQSISYLSGS